MQGLRKTRRGLCPGAPERSRVGGGGGRGDEVSLSVSAGDSYQSWAMKEKRENEAKGPMEAGWPRLDQGMGRGEMSHGEQTIAAVPEPCICTTHFWAEEDPRSCQLDGGYWSRSINTPVQPSVSAARVGGQVLAGEQPGREADPQRCDVGPRTRLLS